MYEIKDNKKVIQLARETPNARFHRLHFREDIKMFEDEVLSSKEVLDEYKATGVDFTFTGVRGIDYDKKVIE